MKEKCKCSCTLLEHKLKRPPARASKRRKDIGANGVSDAEQTEATALSASENEVERPPPSQRRGPHPRPRPVPRTSAHVNGISTQDDEFSLNFDPNAPPPELFSPTALSELTASISGSHEALQDDIQDHSVDIHDETNDAMEVDQELGQTSTPTQKHVSDGPESSSDLPSFKSRRKRF